MSQRMAVHVLDHDSGRRAQIARCAYALGHHAEVYSDPTELAACAPAGGVVVALEDAVRGGVSGLIGLLNQEGIWLAVIATSSNPSIDKAVQAMRDGALDYLPLPLNEENLARVLENVSVEAERLGKRHTRQINAETRLARLTTREREVLSGMAVGLTNKEIGRKLEISPRTVEIHRTNALSKLSARNSTDAVRIWLEADKDFGQFANS